MPIAPARIARLTATHAQGIAGTQSGYRVRASTQTTLRVLSRAAYDVNRPSAATGSGGARLRMKNDATWLARDASRSNCTAAACRWAMAGDGCAEAVRSGSSRWKWTDEDEELREQANARSHVSPQPVTAQHTGCGRIGRRD